MKRIREFIFLFTSLTLATAVLLTGTGWAQQGQWGGFIYLYAKEGAAPDAARKEALAGALRDEIASFHNDYAPAKDKTDTIVFLQTRKYDHNGSPVAGRAPAGIIRVESLDRAKVEGFYKKAVSALGGSYDVELHLAVTRELNYTDKATLARLKEQAPKRGDGNAQPNSVVFPLAKSAAWWALATDERQKYFFDNPQTFGDRHLGHNGVGFMYIQKIFRKLYHSRYIDSQQDFMTYFEYADADASAFEGLLGGLRDKEGNPEWKFVEERPIAWCVRRQTLADIL